MQRTLGDEKRFERGWVHRAGVKTWKTQRAASGSERKGSRGVGPQSGSKLGER